jgi:hypothetical protein
MNLERGTVTRGVASSYAPRHLWVAGGPDELADTGVIDVAGDGLGGHASSVAG